MLARAGAGLLIMVVMPTLPRRIPIIQPMGMMNTKMGRLFTVRRIWPIKDIAVGATGVGMAIVIGAIGAGTGIVIGAIGVGVAVTMTIAAVAGIVKVVTMATGGVGGVVMMADIGASNAMAGMPIMVGAVSVATRVAGAVVTMSGEDRAVTGMVIVELLLLGLALGLQRLVVSLTDQAKVLYRADGSGTHDRLFTWIAT